MHNRDMYTTECISTSLPVSGTLRESFKYTLVVAFHFKYATRVYTQESKGV